MLIQKLITFNSRTIHSRAVVANLMKRHLLQIIFIFSFSIYCTGQTSMHTEISRIDLPKDYAIKNGYVKEIIINRKINPGQDFSYSEKLIYTFPEKSKIRLSRYKNSELELTSEFLIDSLNRVIKKSERFNHKGIGWRTSKYETVYQEKIKDLKMLNEDGSLDYTMRVVLNEYDNPTEIRTLNINNKLIALSTAKYDYENNNFLYTIYKEDGSIVLNKIEVFKKDYEIKRNEYGDLTEFYWPTSSNNVKYLIQYKYDQNGNWINIKKIMIDGKKKKTTEIINRKIKY